ncbi:hypothetical protein [Natrononativus amylolyticus]|uniref:hypothetical protein n=1 Tax=Natrononativus amylolyticus TaxID=2963434 RepID=UPI0020CD2E31|nr:hypothetical protein [Natrononativus amylolyticus]
MIAKRVLPLALLHAADGRIKGKTRFQKLAFLADQRLEEKGIDPYEFIPYDYGPFSKDLQEEIEYLEKEGLIEITQSRTYGGGTRYDYKLTSVGQRRSDKNFPSQEEVDDLTIIGEPEEEQERLRELYRISWNVVKEFNDIPISNLIDHVYTEYPSYAKNSVLN